MRLNYKLLLSWFLKLISLIQTAQKHLLIKRKMFETPWRWKWILFHLQMNLWTNLFRRKRQNPLILAHRALQRSHPRDLERKPNHMLHNDLKDVKELRFCNLLKRVLSKIQQMIKLKKYHKNSILWSFKSLILGMRSKIFKSVQNCIKTQLNRKHIARLLLVASELNQNLRLVSWIVLWVKNSF